MNLKRMQNIISAKKNKSKLSPEARTEMESKLINMKTRAEDRKKAAEKANEPKEIKSTSYIPEQMSEDEKRRAIRNNMAADKAELRKIKEREDNKYGSRYDSARKDNVYTGAQIMEESIDKMNKESIKRNLEMYRKDSKELPRPKSKK